MNEKSFSKIMRKTSNSKKNIPIVLTNNRTRQNISEVARKKLTSSTDQISVKKTTFYDKASFSKIIGDAFRTEYACSLSSHFTY